MNTPLNIIFAGTPVFAAIALEKLIQSQHNILAVYTQPDKPAGRGLKLTPSAVKTLAQAHALPLKQPTSLKDVTEQEKLKALGADVIVVAAYGMILPQAVLDIPRLGCVNIHPSLLPRWRGAAPIQRTIFAGDKMTGVTIMRMDAGLDTGPILLKQEYALQGDETTQALHDKLAQIGADSLLETLNLLAENQLVPQPQDNTYATYASKITKEEACIDWSQSAEELDCKIRAFNPWPIAYTHLDGVTLRIGKANIVNTSASPLIPGTIQKFSKDGIEVITGKGSLLLTQLQLPGGKMLAINDFYNANQQKITVGKQFS